jgi:hypothetical protein
VSVEKTFSNVGVYFLPIYFQPLVRIYSACGSGGQYIVLGVNIARQAPAALADWLAA